MKKDFFKGIAVGCIATVIISGSIVIASTSKTIEVYPDNVKIYANGNYVSESNFTYNDRTYVPLRAVLELMDCSIEYDTNTKTVQAKNNYQDLTDTVGACFNGDSTVYRTIMNVAETTGNVFIEATAFVDYDFTLTNGGDHLMFMDNDKYVAIDTNADTSNTKQQSYKSNTNASLKFPLYLFSDEDEPIYLGKLITNKYDEESVFNEYGDFGSKYKSTSIFNEYGKYGSKYGQYSAFYKYASHPPIIVDSNLNEVGRLTANKNFSDGVTWNELVVILEQNNQ